MSQYIDFKKTYTLAYINNYDADQMELTSFSGKKIHEAFQALPTYRGRICWRNDITSRLREKVEIAGRLKFNLPLLKDRHTSNAVRYIKCAYNDGCWNCQKTLRDEFAAYIALSLPTIREQRKYVKELIGETNQEVLFVFDNSPEYKSAPLDNLFVN